MEFDKEALKYVSYSVVNLFLWKIISTNSNAILMKQGCRKVLHDWCVKFVYFKKETLKYV